MRRALGWLGTSRTTTRAVGLVAFLGSLALSSSSAEGKAVVPGWSDVLRPAQGPARAIGGYSSGCVQGASELALKGPGYQIMKPERRRMFGHPRLVDFVRELGAKVAEAGLEPLGVGDLGQARGGPAPNGHASHQNGLDADLWFSPGVAGVIEAPSMVDGSKPSSHWSERVPKLLALAAADVRVDRIFVNPVIKQALCAATPSAERAGLRKLRPWWGHDAHFHVRLACPEDSPECAAQPPLPAGDGCAEVDWWLSEASARERKEKAGQYQKRVGARPELPPSCSALLR
jgi:penicillin-insensitive murein DD-endopeptidase